MSDEIVTYLYNKYGECDSSYNPITINEEIYFEGFPDFTQLNGKATRLAIISSDNIMLYTEESMSVYYCYRIRNMNGEYIGNYLFYD